MTEDRAQVDADTAHGWTILCYTAGYVTDRALKYPEDDRQPDILVAEIERYLNEYYNALRAGKPSPLLPSEQKLTPEKIDRAHGASLEALAVFESGIRLNYPLFNQPMF